MDKIKAITKKSLQISKILQMEKNLSEIKKRVLLEITKNKKEYLNEVITDLLAEFDIREAGKYYDLFCKNQRIIRFMADDYGSCIYFEFGSDLLWKIDYAISSVLYAAPNCSCSLIIDDDLKNILQDSFRSIKETLENLDKIKRIGEVAQNIRNETKNHVFYVPDLAGKILICPIYSCGNILLISPHDLGKSFTANCGVYDEKDCYYLIKKKLLEVNPGYSR